MNKRKKGRRLSHEILGLLAVSIVIALFLFQILGICAIAIVDELLAAQEVVLTESQLAALDNGVFNLSLVISVVFFVLFFLFLLGDRLSYIQDVIRGIDALRNGQMEHRVPVEGNSELTRLAEAVNYLSATQREIKEKERALNEEKEQLIRALSHDIRTPLTSILAYSEYLAEHEDCPPEGRREQLALIRQKALQIRELTDILLEGGRRSPEHLEDARLLMEQLAEEFEEALEDAFRIFTEVGRDPFSGIFDVQELRRIFDNLASNVRKYADPSQPVTLSVCVQGGLLLIRQRNAVRPKREGAESHRMGLSSIRRIARNYAGQVELRQENAIFEITITLSEF